MARQTLISQINGEWWTPEMVADLHGVKLYKVMAHINNGVSMKTLITRPWAEPIRARANGTPIVEHKVQGIQWTWGFVYFIYYTYQREHFLSVTRAALRHAVSKHIRELGPQHGIVQWYRDYIVLPGTNALAHMQRAYQLYLEKGDAFLKTGDAWGDTHITEQQMFDMSVKRTMKYPKLIHHLPKDKITEMVMLVCRRVKEGIPYEE